MDGGWVNSWTERLGRFAPQRKQQTIDHAVRLVTDNGASEGEKQTALNQLHAALDVDPAMLFSVVTSVQGGGASQADVEKARAGEAVAEAKFQGLVQATQTLRETLSDLGMIGDKDRLPETAAQWKDAVARVVDREAQKVRQQEQYLETQKLALEAMREKALQEIEARVERARLQTAGLAKMAHDVYTGLSGNLGLTFDQLNVLSFDYAQVQARGTAQPGGLVQGEGVFVGLWTPKFANGSPLGIECEVWAAPEDLQHAPNVGSLKTYNETVQTIAALRQWHGHDGGNFTNEAAIIDSLDKAVKRHDKQHGTAAKDQWFEPTGADKWFIPPRALLDGKAYNPNGNFEPVQDENLFDMRDTGAFSNTFTTQEGSGYAHWYWSSTEYRDNRDFVWHVRFSDGHADWNLKDHYRLSCRLVRVGSIRHLTI